MTRSGNRRSINRIGITSQSLTFSLNYARDESRATIHESGAAHRVSAVEAFVAGAVADGDRAANIAGGGIVGEMRKLGVKLLQKSRFSL